MGDIHIGAKNDDAIMLKQQIAFFDNIFFPHLKQNDINHVVHMGDMMDRRKYVNYNTLYQFKFKILHKFKRLMFINIIGNHDTYFKNTNQVNSPTLLFDHEYGINVVDDPYSITIDDREIMCVPWITEQNQEKIYNAIDKSKADVLCGHFEFDNFELTPGVYHKGGLDETHKLFKKFKLILSGHFHIQQKRGNIHYVGTPYQMNFGESRMAKGFHVLDTKTLKTEFILNPVEIFKELEYSDIKIVPQLAEDLTDCYVKLRVLTKTKPHAFDDYLEKLNCSGAASITVIDESYGVDNGVISVESKDTLAIINEEIDGMSDTDITDKNAFKTIVHSIYSEALAS